MHLYLLHHMINHFTLDDLELEYPIIYGISTPLRHLKLGFEIERHPDFLVEFHEDIESYLGKSAHACYLIAYLDDNTQFLIIKNKGSKTLFYPRYKKVDYLLCAIGEEELNPESLRYLLNLREYLFVLHFKNLNKKKY